MTDDDPVTSNAVGIYDPPAAVVFVGPWGLVNDNRYRFILNHNRDGSLSLFQEIEEDGERALSAMPDFSAALDAGWFAHFAQTMGLESCRAKLSEVLLVQEPEDG
jgi:hypothetical protein